ncbi:MAG: hypothetical protein AAGA80_01150 [Cyanobacteria bacterium P01_F01_bin.143]
MALDWTNFISFNTNDVFNIVEDDNILGSLTANGKVVEINGNKLVLELNIPSQTIPISGILAAIAGIDSVDAPEITGTLSITVFNEGTNDREGVGNRLEVSGTYVDSNGTQSFSYTDTDLRARLRRRGERIRLEASNSFLSQISNDSNISRLARLEFEKTGDPNVNEMDVGNLPLGDKIELFLER